MNEFNFVEKTQYRPAKYFSNSLQIPGSQFQNMFIKQPENHVKPGPVIGLKPVKSGKTKNPAGKTFREVNILSGGVKLGILELPIKKRFATAYSSY